MSYIPNIMAYISAIFPKSRASSIIGFSKNITESKIIKTIIPKSGGMYQPLIASYVFSKINLGTVQSAGDRIKDVSVSLLNE